MPSIPSQDLRPLRPGDFEQVAEVYRDAVLSQAVTLYSPEQVQVWARHVDGNESFEQLLRQGYGLVSVAAEPGVAGQGAESLEAFAVLHPQDRMALLYCRGRSSRQGRATALVRGLERYAKELGCAHLRTEASQLSRPLLERLGWRAVAEDTALYDGVPFLRWRMIRDLP